MEIRLHSSEYCVHEPPARKGLSWNYIAVAVGFTFVTATALVAEPPAEPIKSSARVPTGYASVSSPQAEVTPPARFDKTAIAVVPVYAAVPSPKPSNSATVSEPAPRPQARVAVSRPSATVVADTAASCDGDCRPRAPMALPQQSPASVAPFPGTPFASQDYDDTAHRAGPFAMATSALGKLAKAPLTVLAFSRDTVIDVADGRE